jgi:type VI secretion system protein ImpC
MATTAEKAGKVAQTKEAEVSLLDQAIGATKQTEPDRAKELLRTLTEQALEGTVTYSKNLTVTFNKAISLRPPKLPTIDAANALT